MSQKKLIGIISLAAIVIAIPLTVYLARQQQEIRQRASGEAAELFFAQTSCSNTNKITSLAKIQGESGSLLLCLDTRGLEVSAFDIIINLENLSNYMTIAQMEGADASQFNALLFNSLNGSTMQLTKANTNTAAAISGVLHLASLNYTIDKIPAGDATPRSGNISVSATVTSPTTSSAITTETPALAYAINPIPTNTPTPIPPTATPTATPVPTNTPVPTATPTLTPAPTNTPIPTPSPASPGIGVSLNAGGSINYLELNGQNIVDTNDCGRLIQLALIEYQDNGRQNQVPALCVLSGYYTVNPTQGCDGCGHSSPIIEGNSPAYIKVQPLNWVRNGERADFYIEQRIEQTNANPRTYRVRYNIIHLGNDTHYMGHEAPAMYLVNPYNTLVTYNGTRPWQNDTAVTTTSPLGRYEFQTNEHWASVIDPATQQGLTIVDPDNRYWSFWKSANNAPNSNFITAGKTFVYRGPLAYSFEVYFVLGTWQQGRQAAYQLIQNHETSSQVTFYDYPHTTLNGNTRQTSTKDNGSWNVLNRVVDYQAYSPLQISGIRQWWSNETEPSGWITVSPASFLTRGWMALRNTAPAGNYQLNVKVKTATNEESAVSTSETIQLIGTPAPRVIAGDVNNDNCVSRRDYEEWLYAFFHNGIPRNALYKPDINSDRQVDLADFNLWQQAMRSSANLCAQAP